MREYTPENPRFSGTINVYETTDPNHADVLNDPIMQLIQNDLVLLGRRPRETSLQEIREIIAGTYDPYDGGEDDTGEIDDDGTVIEEATAEDIQAIKDSYWTD